MEVRPLQREDELREALRAHGRAWEEAYDDILPGEVIRQVAAMPSGEVIAERFAELRDRRYYVAADDGDTVRGYAYFRWGSDETKEFVGPGEAGLKEIYVDPDYWGEGFGTALLEYGLDRIPDSIDALKLEVLSENEVGDRFYRARGFEPTGESTTTIAGDEYPITIYALDL